MQRSNLTRQRLSHLIPSPNATWSFVAGAAALLAGIGIRRIAAETWEAATDEDVPENPAAPGVGWSDALVWAGISGVAVAVARVVAKRGVAAHWRRKHPQSPRTWRSTVGV
jgi:hypothetical protein